MQTSNETKKLFLSPKGAAKYDSLYSTLTFNIPMLFSHDKNTLYNSIRVLHAEIPFSFYLINSNNNKLVLSTGTITLDQGNFNANSFMVMLLTKLPSNMTITFNNTTGKFTLLYNTTFSILPSSSYRLVGLDSKLTYTSTNNQIVFPFMANFLGTKNIYINTTNLALDNYNTSTKTYSTLLCIANNVPPYGVIYYDNRTSNKNIIKSLKDDNLEIQLLDDDFQAIDFNNCEWSITLEIETVKQVLYINNQTLHNN